MSVIKKIKGTAKKVNSIGILGLVVAGSLAFGFSPAKIEAPEDTVLWGRTSTGGWVPTTTGAICQQGPNTCKMYFPEGQNPNINPSGGTSAGPELGYVAP